MTQNIQEIPSVKEYYPDNIVGEYPTEVGPLGWVGSPAPEDWKTKHVGYDVPQNYTETLYAVLDENNIIVATFAEIKTEEAIQRQKNRYHFYRENGIPHPVKSKFVLNPEYDPTKTKVKASDVSGYPSIGGKYDAERNVFIPPCPVDASTGRPVDGYVFDFNTLTWDPEEGKAYDLHNDGILYTYNKELKVWNLVE